MWNDTCTFLNFLKNLFLGCIFKAQSGTVQHQVAPFKFSYSSKLETESRKNDTWTRRKCTISFKPRPRFPGVKHSWNLLHYAYSRESNTLTGPQNILESITFGATKAAKGFLSCVNFVSVGQVTPSAHWLYSSCPLFWSWGFSHLARAQKSPPCTRAGPGPGQPELELSCFSTGTQDSLHVLPRHSHRGKNWVSLVE